MQAAVEEMPSQDDVKPPMVIDVSMLSGVDRDLAACICE